MFLIDERIQSTCFMLGDWPLSRVFLKNDQQYNWFILVPRKENIQEIYHLSKNDRELLMEEINQLSLLVKKKFNPDKLNIASLGNIVSQLHIHVVGRRSNDVLWPQGIWQSSSGTMPYNMNELSPELSSLSEQIKEIADFW